MCDTFGTPKIDKKWDFWLLLGLSITVLTEQCTSVKSFLRFQKLAYKCCALSILYTGTVSELRLAVVRRPCGATFCSGIPRSVVDVSYQQGPTSEAAHTSLVTKRPPDPSQGKPLRRDWVHKLMLTIALADLLNEGGHSYIDASTDVSRREDLAPAECAAFVTLQRMPRLLNVTL